MKPASVPCATPYFSWTKVRLAPLSSSCKISYFSAKEKRFRFPPATGRDIPNLTRSTYSNSGTQVQRNKTTSDFWEGSCRALRPACKCSQNTSKIAVQLSGWALQCMDTMPLRRPRARTWMHTCTHANHVTKYNCNRKDCSAGVCVRGKSWDSRKIVVILDDYYGTGHRNSVVICDLSLFAMSLYPIVFVHKWTQFCCWQRNFVGIGDLSLYPRSL